MLIVWFSFQYLYLADSIFCVAWNFLVDLDSNPSEKSNKASSVFGPLVGPLSSKREQLDTESKESARQVKANLAMDGLRNANDMSYPPKVLTKEQGNSIEDSGSNSDTGMPKISFVRHTGKNVKGSANDRMEDASELVLDAVSHPTFPTEVISLRSNILFPLCPFVELKWFL